MFQVVVAQLTFKVVLLRGGNLQSIAHDGFADWLLFLAADFTRSISIAEWLALRLRSLRPLHSARH